MLGNEKSSIETVRFLTSGTGELTGHCIQEQRRTLADLQGVFLDEPARQSMNQSQLVYQVQLYQPVPDGTSGGLFFGNTTIQPGRVGDEYFMTKGHFHARRQCAEYYWCLRGQGALILMDESRRCWMQAMSAGSLHYIPANTAHRTVNTGDEALIFGACWPADAGHDYQTIAKRGFSARLRCVEDRPVLVPVRAMDERVS